MSRRAFVVVLDACGAGELPDAAAYGDAGANTLGHLASAVGGLRLPALERLGLGSVQRETPADRWAAASRPPAPLRTLRRAMPELPEVETVRRQVAPRAEGRRIAELEVLDERWSAPRSAAEISDAVRGRRIERVGRRGKYLSWTLEDEVHLVMHLRMTGNLLYDAAPQPPHTRVRIVLSDDHEVLFVDQRRFGTGELVLGDAALAEFFAQRLGLEPFDERFTTDHLRALGRGSRAPIKAFLLDQRRIAGVGNIYADEALYRARIHPLRPAGRLTRAQWERLRLAIIDALRAGIDARGATIDDFRDTEGVRGSFQDQFLVHLRQGEPCLNCGREIVKLVAAGRGTYVCEACQPRPRRARRK